LLFLERSRARQLREELERTYPVEAIGSAPMLWTWLPEGATALVYASLPGELLVWTVSREGVRLTREAELGAKELRRQIVAAGGPITSATLNFAATLIPPTVSLAPDRTLLIVPDGALYDLPFASLAMPDGRYLIEHTQLVLAPSLTVARATSRQPLASQGSPLLVGAGDAVESAGLAQLPHVAEEIASLKELYPPAEVLQDSAATVELVSRALRGRGLVHVAAHAVADAVAPWRSRIVLGPGPQGLEARAISGLRLAPGAVVVLAACDTGRALAVRGEGPLPIARAFLLAGATAVIASASEVRDDESASLSLDVHRRLATGRSPIVALAEAQRTAIAAKRGVRTWSAFMVFGGIS
jgi:CHAT domain-containing protein